MSDVESPSAAYEAIGEALEHLRNARWAGIPDEQTIDCLDDCIAAAIGARGRLIAHCGVERRPARSLVDRTRCVVCGKDLTDPKNAGDPDVDGDWVCRSEFCRAVHEVEMEVNLGDLFG